MSTARELPHPSTAFYARESARLNPELHKRSELEVPDVPVGTIPPELQDYWIENDRLEVTWLGKWFSSNAAASEAVKDEALWRMRLRRAVEERQKAERRRVSRAALDRATSCPSCELPNSIRARRVDVPRDEDEDWTPPVFIPEPDQHVAVTPARSVVACFDCRRVLEAELTERAAAQETAAGTTRGEAARRYLDTVATG